jgi:3D (Asp-Asp-Asp) domain-containing protein
MEANNMKKRFLSIVASAAIFTTVATTVQAEEVIVHKGDTLWDFSQEYGVSVQTIKNWNNLSSDLIYPNEVLEISPMKQVIVKKGDTLWKIAQDHKVSVEELMQWNTLSSDIIHPGMKLTIYTDLKRDAGGNVPTASVNKASVEQDKGTENITAAAQNETEVTQPAKSLETVDLQPKEAVDNVITVEATAYTASCEGCSGVTSTGIDLQANPDAKVISVDPSVIPLGSKVHVEGYGYATAADTGGAIQGNKIDVFIPDYTDAVQWGKKQVKVKLLID